MMKIKKKIGQIFVDLGFIELSELEHVLEAFSYSKGKRLGSYLVEVKELPVDSLYLALATQYQTKFFENESSHPINDDVLIEFAEKDLITGDYIPIFYQPYENSLIVLCELEFLEQQESINQLLKPHFKYQKLIVFPAKKKTIDGLKEKSKTYLKLSENREIKKSSFEGVNNVDAMINDIIESAIDLSSSDIHLEPKKETVQVRFRLSGVLEPFKEETLFDKELMDEVSVKLKSRTTTMLYNVKDIPQDGKFNYSEGMDMRVSSCPTIWGEKFVLRLLDSRNIDLPLDQLIIHPKALEDLRKCSQQKEGLILITGPTGSGKSTTLYSSLKELNSRELNIHTLEDPVEYTVSEFTQTECGGEMTFTQGLKSLLRQDPDVILVGEVRDSELAKLCLQAANTGHLVFSTLHTNDAPSTIRRLIDLGLSSLSINTALKMVTAQRLLRKLCEHCKVPLNNNEFRTNLKGCELCYKGKRGRISVMEYFVVDDEIKSFIFNEDYAGIEKYVAKNYFTLSTYGEYLVASGLIDRVDLNTLV